jgi:hypothetical protein
MHRDIRVGVSLLRIWESIVKDNMGRNGSDWATNLGLWGGLGVRNVWPMGIWQSLYDAVGHMSDVTTATACISRQICRMAWSTMALWNPLSGASSKKGATSFIRVVKLQTS